MITEAKHQELRAKYNPDGSNRRLSQLRMLDMLKFLDDFCREHNIGYWLDSGTLLGAVRHGGFIPWDDDVDVCMTREDYLRFKKIFGSKQIGDYVMQTPETDAGFIRFWGVLRDTKSEYVKDGDNPSEELLKYRGLYIDIFPLIDRYTGFSRELSKKLAWRVNHYYALEAKQQQRIGAKTKAWFFVVDKMVYPLFRLLCRKRHDVYVMDYGIRFYSQRRAKDIFPLSRIMFEGVELNAPGRPVEYCKMLYGDNCMEMPNEENIYNHHITVNFK